MKKIVFFTKYTPKGPSSRYRTYQYESYFKEEFETEYFPFFDDKYIDSIFNNKKAGFFSLTRLCVIRMIKIFGKLFSKDLIVVEYELVPYFPPLFEYLFKLTGVGYILDFDDAVFHNYDNSKNKIIKFFLGSKIKIISKNATHIITGSPYLTQFLIQFNANVTEIPTSICFEYYQKNKKTIENDKLIVGWLGSNTTSINLLIVKDVISEIKKTFPNVVFRFCGFNDSLLSHFNRDDFELVDWSPINEMCFLNEISIGIMPLEDNLFNKGKCGFKLIQYMAMGKPTISSPLEANVKINRANGNLFATTKKEWSKALITMINDYENYKKVGIENIEIVRKHYSSEENSKMYIKLFKSII